MVNYKNKVIGIYISRDDIKGYLPTLPSNIIFEDDIPIKFMDDVDLNDYNITKNFLETLYEESKQKIACLPKIKIMEDKMIVGILTNGNQFVKLANPEVDSYNDELIVQNEKDYLVADTIIENSANISNDINSKKIDTIKNIQLEESFYKMFRNIFRSNINNIEYRKEKIEITEILKDISILYLDKLQQIDIIIRNVMETSVIFSVMSETVLKRIKNIINCNQNEDECKDLDYCMLSAGKSCLQILPNKNLINGLDNQELYFAKLADELIRYKKLNRFISDTRNYLTFSETNYNINDNEILIIQSLLNSEYFNNLKSGKHIIENKYVNNFIYDIVNPDKTKKYQDTAKLDLSIDTNLGDELNETLIEISDSGCSLTKKLLIGYLQEMFPPKTYEIYYRTPNSICTYEIMLNILRDSFKDFENLSIFELKKNLIEIYKYYKDNIKLLIILLIELNKKIILEKVLDKIVTMDNMLLSEEYYLTYIDMILIAKYYNLPIIFISSMPIIEKYLSDTFLIPNKIKTTKWYFIKVPSIVTRVKKNDYPVYKLLTYRDNLKIDIDVISQTLKKNIENELKNSRDILTFLLDNVKPKQKYKLKLIDNIKPLKQKLKIID